MITNRILTVDLPAPGISLNVSRLMSVIAEPTWGMAPRVSTEYELFYVTGSELSVVVEGKDDVIRKGEIFLNYPGQKFGIHRSERPVSLLHCHFDFGRVAASKTITGLSDWASRLSRMDAWTSGFSRILHLPDKLAVRNNTVLLETLRRVNHFQRTAEHGYAIAAEAQFLIFLQCLSQETLRALSATAAPQDVSSSGLLVAHALDFIEQKMNINFSLYEVANNLEINPQYLSRIFKAQTGLTVGRYILRRKIAVAKERLLSTRMNIKQVAMSVGFNDAQYFSRRFHSEMGLSPRAYQLTMGV